jgi:spore coat protein U-like protein
VNFGVYDTLSPSAVDGVGNLAVGCDAPVSLTISLGPGTGTYSERAMAAGAQTLGYNLYTDASRAMIWGDGGSGTETVSMTAASADIPVYGRIPARQNVAPGGFADTIVVTITY